jgi:putative oxygen-independent coproporphyrinogen III oxidase
MFFYIHIPFCRQKCQYCKFALTPDCNDVKIRVYLDALKREMEIFFLENSGVPIETIYFGGGTPSVLSVTQIEEILNVFKIQRGFASIGEITLESNPEDINDDFIQGIFELGVNRLSLGIQTISSESLRLVGRSESNEYIFRALECLGRSRMQNISIDLIAGLPLTVPGQVCLDLESIFTYLTPTHVSVYMLEDESYPADWACYLPTEDAIRKEYLSAKEWLTSKGIGQYELSNFAKKGFESRHNQSYWNHSPYRWFWLSAASFIDGERQSNSASFAGYYRGDRILEAKLTPESLRVERIMFGLRTSGVSLDEVQNTQAIIALQSEGLVEVGENKVFLTSTWIFLNDYIIGELI